MKTPPRPFLYHDAKKCTELNFTCTESEVTPRPVTHYNAYKLLIGSGIITPRLRAATM